MPSEAEDVLEVEIGMECRLRGDEQGMDEEYVHCRGVEGCR